LSEIDVIVRYEHIMEKADLGPATTGELGKIVYRLDKPRVGRPTDPIT
jgi:hypothetical protein